MVDGMSPALPECSCWVAEAWIDCEGQQATPKAPSALGIFAVSVHEQYPTDAEQRVRLLGEIADRLKNRVPLGKDSLWVYPGGYFGFDARAYAQGDKDKAWPGFDISAALGALPSVLQAYPDGARLLLGADESQGIHQHAWLCWHDAAEFHGVEITRGCVDLPQRKVMVGPIRAAFFICGEFTGINNENNGPYFEDRLLDNPVEQLADCQLLVDLAHSRVPGTVDPEKEPFGIWVHQKQMLRFSAHGASVLAHHHPGGVTSGRASNRSQSNWIYFRDGERCKESALVNLP